MKTLCKKGTCKKVSFFICILKKCIHPIKMHNDFLKETCYDKFIIKRVEVLYEKMVEGSGCLSDLHKELL